MSTIRFKCKLLTDVILNQKSASEGNRQTLDFIPGNNFLGIVAGNLYRDDIDKEKALILFHTGDVKFGDAHPSKDNLRGLKIPASMFYPKLKKMTDECYIHHLIPNLSDNNIKKMQLKQCRTGFYLFSSTEKKAEKVEVERNFAIKSAYDKEWRRSKDEMMYGYESLGRNSEFYFEVYFNDVAEKYKEEVIEALVGEKRIGCSRTAQYGLVRIEKCEYEQVISCFSAQKADGENYKNYVAVYADARLIFLDEYGVPTFRPDAKDLGLENGKILWNESQVRTFQYAPWNYKRQAYDTDRCGVEKGSVFIVEVPEEYAFLSTGYVGFYQNEGFGKVIYNPDFLMAQSDGKAIYELLEGQSDELIIDSPIDNSLLKYLKNKKNADEQQNIIYEKVNAFVNNNGSFYRGDSFSSQWGNIRSIAMNKKGKVLKDEILFYLSHGIASDRWNKKKRKEKFEEFINDIDIECLQNAVINLAAEMGKKCSKDNN